MATKKKVTRKSSADNSDKPWVANYPPLAEWLEKHDARCMSQVPASEKPSDAEWDWTPHAYIETWIINRRPFVLVVHGCKRGWFLYTDANTNRIDETLADAEQRLGLTAPRTVKE